MRTLPLIAAAVPGVVVALASVVQIGLAASGRDPLWAVKEVTAAEAAALRDPATLARMSKEGADLRAARPVRAGVLGRTALTLTPLDAAIAARRGEVVEFLLWAAPPLDVETWTRARCLAALVAEDDVSAALAKQAPPLELDCSGYVRPW